MMAGHFPGPTERRFFDEIRHWYWQVLHYLGPLTPLWVPYGACCDEILREIPIGIHYAGQAGSTYDSAANPAQTIGVVAYCRPYAPLPATAPAAASAAAPAAPPWRRPNSQKRGYLS